MNEWWKSPVLQGDDNDYGDYDYMIEEIPKSYCCWKWSLCPRWKDDSGHLSHLHRDWEYFFHTLDGWDSQSGSDCWRCVLSEKIHGIKWKLRKWFAAVKLGFECFSDHEYKWKWFKLGYKIGLGDKL